MTNTKFSNRWAGRVSQLGWLVAIIIVLVIVADQWLKIWIKTHFYLGEEMEIFPWFRLKFIENNGFAFGLEWFNKYVLTFGRILAVVFFIWAMRRLLDLSSNGGIFNLMKESDGKEKRSPVNLPLGFYIAFALIIAGAAGNIFDCVFYGEIFNNPAPPETAVMFPQSGGYAGWFEGRVVDMLYFPLFSFDIGNSHFEFFEYIFNIADSAITIGVLMLLLFYRDASSAAMMSLFEKK
ncbi:MAG: signal peptidase II [Muribaculaceae bacterium]|nr:signal peptidase II [Muribaculaceae bacterium]